MTGRESLELLNKLKTIRNFLLAGDHREAFFNLGVLSENLAQTIRIDEVSFKPTVKFDSEEGYE